MHYRPTQRMELHKFRLHKLSGSRQQLCSSRLHNCLGIIIACYSTNWTHRKIPSVAELEKGLSSG